MRFKLSGNIITRLALITDISVVGDGISTPLICESERTTSQSPSPESDGNWHLHPERLSIGVSNRIEDSGRGGWVRTRATTSAGYRQVKLRRESDTGAQEGVFTCWIRNDDNQIRSLYVLYPSEL